MGVNALHHVMIGVQDPDMSRRFYEDVLLLQFVEIQSVPIQLIWRGRAASGTLLATQVGSTFVMLAPRWKEQIPAIISMRCGSV